MGPHHPGNNDHDFYVLTGDSGAYIAILVHNQSYCPIGTAVSYGEEGLAKATFEFRRQGTAWTTYPFSTNLAVAKAPGFAGRYGDLVYGISDSVAKDERWHSEFDIWHQLTDAGYSPSDVTGLYSERSACPLCAVGPLITSLRPEVPITWSVVTGRGSTSMLRAAFIAKLSRMF